MFILCFDAMGDKAIASNLSIKQKLLMLSFGLSGLKNKDVPTLLMQKNF
jgi:hypothetical protein